MWKDPWLRRNLYGTRVMREDESKRTFEYRRAVAIPFDLVYCIPAVLAAGAHAWALSGGTGGEAAVVGVGSEDIRSCSSCSSSSSRIC